VGNGGFDEHLSDRRQRRGEFRTIAIQGNQTLNLDIVQSIVEERLSDFTAFTERVLTTDGFRTSDS